MNFSKIHRKIAPILLIPLLLTAVSGLAYRLGRSWFGLDDEFGELMMSLHEGRFLGDGLVPFYVLLMGLGLLGLLITGLVVFRKRRALSRNHPTQNWRRYHYMVALAAALPLLISLLTGIAYRLGVNWFGVSEESAEILLVIHQGAYLGSALKPFYVLGLGLSLLALIITGLQMLGVLRQWPSFSR
ncbi:PepSY domain-containing protein [Synechocystis sp. LKSZ1]|uniref:PepSY domain-containing protein n=1 Tax=Synechocystis sp. LKSZ1 TaxID=3144951 RepID=UPI00336BDF6E